MLNEVDKNDRNRTEELTNHNVSCYTSCFRTVRKVF